MRMFSLVLVMLFNVIHVHAQEIGVVEIDEPIASNGVYLIYGTDGRIYEIDQSKRKLIELSYQALENRVAIDLKIENDTTTDDILGKRSQIKSAQLTDKILREEIHQIKSNFELQKNREQNTASLKNAYVTNVESEAVAKNLFFTMRTDTKSRSQCFNRAHVWAWELNKRYIKGRKIQVGKIWLFFTKKYIRNYDYKWWFHIAPYITVNHDLRVLDRSFTDGPKSEREWTDRFIKSKQSCPEVFKYSDYREHQMTEDCYVIKSSVFYWQPWQVKNVELQGEERTEWLYGELKAAYRNAISWFARVP